jgi:alpha-beta hydrolase superfamily lysophospholipase
MRYCACALFVFLALGLGAESVAADFREEAVSVPFASGTLSGSLMLPPGSGPFPVALIIAGSGPTDRNGNSAMGLTTRAYQKLAEGLAAQGIATLRYDKRGVGASTASQSESAVRFDDFVNDAIALTAWLERDARFSSVSIIGHSEGSLIGTVAAERDPHVRAFVSLEGAGRNLATSSTNRFARTRRIHRLSSTRSKAPTPHCWPARRFRIPIRSWPRSSGPAFSRSSSPNTATIRQKRSPS